jgi:hypothetical protein
MSPKIGCMTSNAERQRRIERFIAELADGECYIDPKAYDTPHQNAIIQNLTLALSRYGIEKQALGHTLDSGEDIIFLIGTAFSSGAIKRKGGGSESHNKMPSSPENDSNIEFLKEIIQKQIQSPFGTTYNIQGNVENIVAGTQNVTEIYNESVEAIETNKNIDKDEKSKLKEVVSILKTNAPYLITTFTEVIKKIPPPT